MTLHFSFQLSSEKTHSRTLPILRKLVGKVTFGLLEYWIIGVLECWSIGVVGDGMME
jgi:hypothetical protein